MTASPSNKIETQKGYTARDQRAFRLTLIAGLLTLITAVLLLLVAGPQLPPYSFAISIASAILQLCGAFLIYRRRIGLGLIIFFSSAPPTALFVIWQSAGVGTLVTGGFLLIYMMVLPQVLANARQVARAQIFALVVAFSLVAIDLNWPLARPQVAENIFDITLYLFIALFFVFAYLTVRQFPTYGLRGKLITTTLFVAIVAVIAVAAGVNGFTRRALTQKVGEQLDTLANSQAALVGELFFRELTTLQALSLSDRLLSELAARNGSYAESDAEVETTLLAVDASWQEASRTHPMVTAVLQSLLSAELKQFQTLFPENSRLLITDRHGALLAATNKPDDYYFAEAEWWQDAYAAGFGATSFGTPTINPLNGDGIIEISLPLFATQANGVKSLSGILYAAYSLNALEDLLIEAQFGETGQTSVHLPGIELAINENDQLVIYQDNLLSESELTTILESADDMTSVTQNEEPALVSAEIVNTLNHQPIVDELNWIITVQQTESEALVAVQDQQRLNMLLGAIVLLLTGGTAAFVGNRLTQPIMALTAVAEKVTAGDLTAQVEVQTQDEIGTLAKTLNSMTAQVRDSIITLEDRVQERTRALETSIDVSRQLSTILDTQELVESVVNQVRDAFNYYHAQIYLVDKVDENILRMMGGTGEAGKLMLSKGHKLAKGQGLVGKAAVTKAPVLVPDVSQESGWLPNVLLPNTKAEVAIPITLGENVLGVLDVQHDIAGGLNQSDVELLQSIANQVVIALQNADLFTDSVRTNNELALINRMMSSITGSLDLVANMRIVASELAQALDVAHVGIALVTDDQKNLEVVSEYPDPTDDVIGTLLPIEGNLLTEQAMQTGQFAIAYDAQNNPLTASIHGLLRQRNVHMLAVVPMIVGNEFLGTVGFDQTDPNRKMSEQQMRLAETIVYQAATVVQNARLFAQTQARAERERLLNKVVTQVAASLDLQHSLQIIVDELATAVNVDQVRVALIQKESNEMLIIAEHFDHRSSSAMGMKIPIEGNLLTQEVIETRKLVLVEDAQNNPRSAPVHDLFREQGIETVVLLPLVVNDEVIGTIGLDILDKRSIRTDTLQLAETIVYQAANAIQNARLFEQSQAALAETETLYVYTSQLNTATNLDAVLDSAAAPGFQVGAADALLLVYDQDTTEQAGYGQIVASSPKNIVPFGEKLSLREQPFSQLWPSGGKNILFVGDVAEEKRLSAEDRDSFLEMNIQALAIMFLSVGNLQLGQIIIRWHNKQTFTQADERLYGAIAQQASSVVYNRLLFNQTEEALSETAALYQASVDLNSADTYEQVLNTLRQHTILGQGSNDVTLNFFNRVWESDDMPETVNVLARWSTLPDDMPNHYKLITFPEADKVLQPDQWLISADVATDDRMSEKTRAIFMKRFKARSLIYVPLVVGGQWIGFLSGVYSQPRQFPEAQIRRLNVLARQAAVSVRSLQLLSQTRRRADREAMINSINQKIQSAPTVQSALQTAVTELSQALKLKKAVVELANEQLDNHNGNGHTNNNGHNGSEKS